MLVSVIGRLLQPDVSDTAAAQVGGKEISKKFPNVFLNGKLVSCFPFLKRFDLEIVVNVIGIAWSTFPAHS